MAGKLKAPAAALLLVLAGGSGCGMAAKHDETPPHVVRASDGGYEEVMSHEDGEEKPQDKTAEIVVVFGYIASTIGAALLPFLLL